METLRQIPPVNDVLRSEELAEFRAILAQPFVTEILDTVLAETRRELAQSKSPVSRAELTATIAGEVARRMREISIALVPGGSRQCFRRYFAYQSWTCATAGRCD